MSWFQLDSVSVVERAVKRGKAVEIPSLAESVLRGILGFTLLSIAGFAPWAITGLWLYRHLGEAGMYLVCALIFLGLSAPLLHRLIVGPGSMQRFYKLFCLAFSAYSLLWICGWMSLRGHSGSLVGLLSGTIAMGWIIGRAFESPQSTIKVIAALFVLNATGYFAGGWIEAAVASMKSIPPFETVLSRPSRMVLAKLLWGVCYGVGLGGGMGIAFHLCQARTRAALREFNAGQNRASHQ